MKRITLTLFTISILSTRGFAGCTSMAEDYQWTMQCTSAYSCEGRQLASLICYETNSNGGRIPGYAYLEVYASVYDEVEGFVYAMSPTLGTQSAVI